VNSERSSNGNLDVWSMPRTGIVWCECSEDHELTKEFVVNTMIEMGLHPVRQLTLDELIELTAAVWNYEEVCRFFVLAVEEAALHIHGHIDSSYPLQESLSIVGYFSKTWQGCPDEACSGLAN